MRVVLVLAAIVAASYARKHYDGYHVLEVIPENKQQVWALQSLMLTRDELDFWLEPTVPGAKVHVMVDPELVADLTWVLELKGMSVNVLDDDVQWKLWPTSRSFKYVPAIDCHVARAIDEEVERLLSRPDLRAFDYSDFNTYDDMMDELDNLAASCAEGFTCNTAIAGQSTEGRDLKYLRIYTGNGKPWFLIDSLTHAREWLAGATVFNIISILLDQHSSITDGRAYAEKYNWLILPLVNPDGYQYSWDTERLWRKSRKPNTGSTCVGTDLNRNYDYQWDTGGSSDSPCSDTYNGGEAANNPEVVAMQDLGQSLKPFAMLSFHTYGQYYLEPYGDGSSVDNVIDHSAVTTATCAAIEDTFNTRWDCGNSADVLYATSGSTADYMRGAVDTVKFAWTPELRGSGFVVSPTEIAPSTEEIWNGLKAKMDHPQFQP